MGQVLPLLVVIAVVAVASLWYRRASGAVRAIDATFGEAELNRLGLPHDEPALLLFTAPGCPPCTVAKRVLDDVAERTGLAVVVADVTDHPEIAAAQHVYRAPTVFVVNGEGHAVSRISGVPRDADLDAVVASVMPAAA